MFASWRQRKRLRWAAAAALSLTVVVAVAIGIGLSNAHAMPILRRAKVHLPDFPAATRPVTVALLSDIHLGDRAMDAERLGAIVRQVNAAHPDLVLLAGDFVAGHDGQGAVERAAGLTAPLGKLQAPMGVVAVLGNHDNWTAPSAVRDALATAGVVVLDNQAIRRGPLAIVGIGDRFSGRDDADVSTLAARRVGGVPIVLTHSPDLAPGLAPNLRLVLAGHTHCGQVVVPGLGSVVTRSPLKGWRHLYDPRYRCGIVRDGERMTIVTAGVGSGTSPVRLGAMPDWWLISVGR